MTLNFPDMPPFPDLADGANYNQAVLDMFTHLGISMVQYMEGLSAEDFFQVMSSRSDTTAGKVLLNGAHGLGGTTSCPNITDFTSTPPPAGFYRYLGGGGGAIGSPEPFGYWGSCVVSRGYDGDASFLCFRNQDPNNPPRAWAGSCQEDGSGLHWTEIFTSANILGTVSQSGGAPTGAVIERGSNANGEYVRFADGTQICTNQAFQTSDTADTTWTYPASFLYPASPGRPAVSGAISSVLGQASFLSIGGIAGLGSVATQVDVRGIDVNGNRVALAASLIAIGRWF